MSSAGARFGRCVAVVLLALIAGCSPDGPDPQPESAPGPGSGFGRAGQWTALPPAPLVARHEAAGEWLGDRFVVLGGWSSRPCPPNARCLPPAEPARRDGASFDPQTGRWTRIADAPVPLTGWNTVAVEGRLYLLTGTQGRADSPAAFLSYDPRQDTWTRHPLPPGQGTLVAAGSAIVLVGSSDEYAPATDSAFDPRTNRWRRLADDPLGPSHGRSAIWVDGSLLLATRDLVPNPGSDRPSLVRLARLDEGLSRWSLLPDSQIIGYTPVSVAGHAVWPYPGSANGGGGGKGDWGRSYPEGAIFDLPTSKWRPLPALPWEPAGACCGGAVVGDRVMVGNQLLDPVTGRWVTVPPLPGGRRSAATIVGSPQTLLVWAGSISDPETDSFSPAENVATGFIFRPAADEKAVAPTATRAATILPCGGGGPNAIDRPDLSGKSTAEARRAERARGHIVRIVGTDRTCTARTDDLRRDRVNLYSENGIVIWAQMF